MKSEMPQPGPRLEEDRRRFEEEASASAPNMDALFGAVAAATVDRPQRLRDRLREMGTPLRIVTVFLMLMAVVGFGGLVGIRGDLVGADTIRVVVLVASLLGLMGAVIASSLRGFHQRPLGRGAWSVLLIALGIPVVCALFPNIWASGASAVTAHIGNNAWKCFVFGGVNGLVAAGIIWLFQRSDRPAAWRLALAGGAGGLVGFTTLQLHCPSRDVVHILLGHASIGFVLAAVALLSSQLRRR